VASDCLFSSPQLDPPRQNLHSVLSNIRSYPPPLRSPEATLHFSPNGKYLLLQDASGIAVLSTTPLAIVFYFASGDLYPAQFSADSEQLTAVSRSLSFVTWKLPGGTKVAAGDLLLHSDCPGWTTLPIRSVLRLSHSGFQVLTRRDFHPKEPL